MTAGDGLTTTTRPPDRGGGTVDPLPARVFLRPIGTPVPLAMAGLTIASLVVSGYELGWYAKSQTVQLGLILVSVPFLLQLVASVLLFLARDGAAGTSVGVLAMSWLGLGLVHIVSQPGGASGALGLLLLASGGVLALSAGAVWQAKPLAGTVFLLAASRFGLAGLYQLTTHGFWQDISGVVGLVTCGLAAYAVLAFELESQAHRALLPTLRRGRGQAAIGGGAGAQLSGVVNEAGVRQSS